MLSRFPNSWSSEISSGLERGIVPLRGMFFTLCCQAPSFGLLVRAIKDGVLWYCNDDPSKRRRLSETKGCI